MADEAVDLARGDVKREVVNGLFHAECFCKVFDFKHNNSPIGLVVFVFSVALNDIGKDLEAVIIILCEAGYLLDGSAHGDAEAGDYVAYLLIGVGAAARDYQGPRRRHGAV